MVRRTPSVSGGAQRRPLHAVVELSRCAAEVYRIALR
jgi:hypothetical protein